MTPTEQDKKLREKLDRLIIENQSEDGSIDISDQRAMRDEILELITADRKRVALEARLDELKKIEIGGDKIWTVDSGTDTAMLIEERIAELKAQQEGLEDS